MNTKKINPAIQQAETPAILKMNGTGNDFVIIDARQVHVDIDARAAQKLASRDNPFTQGCDQVIILEQAKRASTFMRIFNADGSEVEACGNASRCVGYLLSRETETKHHNIQTKGGIVESTWISANHVAVDMGIARIAWNEIPLSRPLDTLHLGITEGELSDPVGVSMGNPHAVFFTNNVSALNLQQIGPKLEHHELFPERANIGFAEIIDQNNIRLRVFERGSGETLACGTGACAALVAAHRRGLAERKATIQLKGGNVTVEWREDGHVILSGSVSEPVAITASLKEIVK